MPADPRDDAALIAAANNGDESALAGIYFRYRDFVIRLARRFTGDEDDALDVLQETFSYLCRKFPGFVLTAAMTTFLYPVVKNLSIASRRKRLRAIGGEELLVNLPSVQPAPDTDRAELAVVLAGLSPAHREVVLMRFVDAMTLEEIAVALAVPLGTVKSRLHHALNALRQDPRLHHYFN